MRLLLKPFFRFWIPFWVLCCLHGMIARAENAQDAKFVLIPGGKFIQGTDGGERALQRAFPLSTAGQNFGNAEGPAHPTWITKPFWIATKEVTVGEFKRFVDETGYITTSESGLTEMVGWDPTPEDAPLYESHDFARAPSFTWKTPGFPQEDDHPVVGVSWIDAKAYCAWRSERDGVTFRLPTEAEWELACRAGTTTWFSFGDRAKGIVHQHANFGNVELEKHRRHAAERQWLLDWDNDSEDGFIFTSPTGNYRPNAWGLYDMHGNVWEWCEDLWLDTVYKDYTRPRFDRPTETALNPVNLDRPQTPVNDFHTIRGGSWYNGDLICRSANRTYWDAEDAACYLGFRLVKEASPETSTAAVDAYQAELDAIEAIEKAGGSLYSGNGLDLEIRFEGNQVDATVFSKLAAISHLRGLQIRWRSRDQRLKQSDLDTIAGLSGLQSLEFADSLGIERLDLSVLTQLKSLRTLRFPRTAPLQDEHLSSLAGMESLVAFRCFGTDGGLTDQGVLHLASNRELETLEIWESDAAGDFLSAWMGCPLRIVALTAPYGRPGAANEETLRGIVEFPALESLTLDGQTKLKSLSGIDQLSRLRELSLERCSGIPDKGFSSLAKLHRLRSLNLLETNAGDHAAIAIAEIPRIERLRIGHTGQGGSVSDLGCAELGKAISLQELHLKSDGVTDSGIRAFGYINRLRELVIRSNSVDGSGLGPIAQLPELRELSLQTPELTDSAFEHLSSAKSVTKIRLAHRGVKPPSALTDRGIMKMANAKWLRELWLPRNDTGITEDQMKVLGERLPDANVIPYTVDWEQ